MNQETRILYNFFFLCIARNTIYMLGFKRKLVRKEDENRNIFWKWIKLITKRIKTLTKNLRDKLQRRKKREHLVMGRWKKWNLWPIGWENHSSIPFYYLFLLPSLIKFDGSLGKTTTRKNLVGESTKKKKSKTKERN